MKIKLKLASAAILALSSSTSAQASEDFTGGMSTCLLRIENEPKLYNVSLSIAMLACKVAGLRKRASGSAKP